MNRGGKSLSRVSAFAPAPPELGERGWPSGPVAFLSRGFRPFFLGAGVWAIVSAGPTSGLPWPDHTNLFAAADASSHARESLFGYGWALLAGFLLTAVPNWTGRRPLVGLPLLCVFLLWVAGRATLVFADGITFIGSVVAEICFLSAIVLLTARDVITSRNRRNLKTVGLVGLFAAANVWFLLAEFTGADARQAIRLGVAALIGLVMLINGRVAPYFAREWLIARTAGRLPSPFDRYDTVALAIAAFALAAWSVVPDASVTAVLLATAGLAHVVRLARWAGRAVWRQPMILVLYVGYGFVALGFVLMAAATLAPHLVDPMAALHAWTSGAIGVTGIGIMTRAARSHTGRCVSASPLTILAYGSVVLAALLRIAGGNVPEWSWTLFAAAALWIAGHAAFLIEYAPMLLAGRVNRS